MGLNIALFICSLFIGKTLVIGKTLEKHPMENDGIFEGDMTSITHEYVDQLIAIQNKVSSSTEAPGTEDENCGEDCLSGAALNDPNALWPNGELYYEITDEFTQEGKDAIKEALKEFDRTCIKMVPVFNSYSNYVKVRKQEGCWSAVGRQRKSPQELSLGDGCFERGTIIHEFMHALGFVHEQSRWDRDQYIKVKEENVEVLQRKNFRKYQLDKLKDLNTDYDYNSVMHFDRYAYSKNGETTIDPIKSADSDMGRKSALSPIDVIEINRLYGCDKEGPKTTQTTRGRFTLRPIKRPLSSQHRDAVPGIPQGTSIPEREETTLDKLTPGMIHKGIRLNLPYSHSKVDDADECVFLCKHDRAGCAGISFDSNPTNSFENCFRVKSVLPEKNDERWSSWINDHK